MGSICIDYLYENEDVYKIYIKMKMFLRVLSKRKPNQRWGTTLIPRSGHILDSIAVSIVSSSFLVDFDKYWIWRKQDCLPHVPYLCMYLFWKMFIRFVSKRKPNHQSLIGLHTCNSAPPIPLKIRLSSATLICGSCVITFF